MATEFAATESFAARLLVEAAGDPEASRLLAMLDERTRWTIQEALDRLTPESWRLIVEAVRSLGRQETDVEEVIGILRGRETAAHISSAERAALQQLVHAFRELHTVL